MSLDTEYSVKRDEGLIEVIPKGEVDIYTSPEFKSQVLSLIDKENLSILINAEYLVYLDSTGLGVLMSILKKAKEGNLNVEITNLKPHIYKLFDITGLNKVFNIKCGD